MSSEVSRKCARCGVVLKAWSSGSVCWRCMMESDSGAIPQAAAGAQAGGFAAPAEPAATTTGAGMRFGDYLLEKEIAHGGMGVVYRASQVNLQRTVAVKLLLLGRYSSAESVERFRREAQSAAALRHPNIVAIHEVGEHEGQQFFSMDYVDGQSLAEEVRLGPLEARRSAQIVCSISRAIHYAHEQGVLHRDLKPSNVLLDGFGQVRITDFGLAKKLDGSSDLTVTGQMVGTPNYLSPEQAAGKHSELGPACDVYSIGALLYELLTGRPPFLAISLQETLLRIRDTEPVSPRALNPALDRDLETICLKCLRKEPPRRYPTALALALDLDRWLHHQPIEARPVSVPERAWLWARRRPRQSLLLGFALTALVALLITLAVANIRILAAQHQTQLKADESRHRLAQLNVATGNRLISDGDWNSALLWFVEAMRLELDDVRREEIDRRRIGAVLGMGPRLSQIFVHDDLLNWAEISADATRVVTASVDGNVRLWDVATGRLAVAPMAHPGVMSVWFTRQGTYVLSLSRDESLRFWDASTGQPVGSPCLLSTPSAMATDLSEDGHWFAITETNAVRIFDTTTMTPVKSLPVFDRSFRAKFSPDGHLLAVAEMNGSIRFWDLTSDPPTNRVLKLPGALQVLAFDPAGKRVATLFNNYTVQVWDIDSGLSVGAPMAHPTHVYSVEFRPDGRWLATACWDGMVRLWDVETGKPARSPLPHGSGVRQVHFTRDGSRLITVTWDSFIRVWNPDSGQIVCPIIRQVGYEAMATLATNGTSVLVASHDAAVRLWELPPEHPARLALRHGGSVEQARFSPDGKSILTCSGDGTIKLWESVTGDVIHNMFHPGDLHEACFSPDGRIIATGSGDGSTRLWDRETGLQRAQTSGQTGRIFKLQFSADGSRFATASADGTSRVWRTRDGQPVTPLIADSGNFGVMSLNPDGTRLLTGNDDGTARLWDGATGAQVGPAMKHAGPVRTVAISPDGRLLLTACTDATTLPYSALLWDAKTCQRVGQAMPHMDGVLTAIFSPDGSRIATGGEDNCAQIWNGTNGERLTPSLPHSGFVYVVSFSPDGRLLLTGSEDSTARVWDVATGEPVSPPLRHGARVHFVSWSPDGREVATCSDDGPNYGTASIWDVSATQVPLEELQLRAEVMSGHYLAPNIGALPLTAKELESRWRALQNMARASR
jgi:WD40 repeat protein